MALVTSKQILFPLSGSFSGSFVGFATGSFTGSFIGNGSGLTNISASAIVGLQLNQIVSGSVTASVNIGTDAFLIRSGSNTFVNIKQNSETTFNSNLFIIRNYTTQQPVLTVSQSIIIFNTQSSVLSGPAPNGGIYFTSSSLYVGLEN